MPIDDLELLRLAPVTPAIGAEVSGLDLTRPLSGAALAEIERALLDRLVLFFRAQPMSARLQLALAEHFGAVAEPHPGHISHPECSRINVFWAGEDKRAETDTWHADSTFRAEIPLGAVLRAVELPPFGGDTLWANMYAAYEALPEATRRRIDGLEAVHRLSNPNNPRAAAFERGIVASGNAAEIAKLDGLRKLEATHPVVCVHPVSGRPFLFVNPTYTSHIVGMPLEESRALLGELYQECQRPEHQLRFRWSADTVAIWDNRCTQHYATADYHPHRRVMHRAAIDGWRPKAFRLADTIVDCRSA